MVKLLLHNRKVYKKFAFEYYNTDKVYSLCNIWRYLEAIFHC